VGPSDAELVARVLAVDDRRAFAALVRRHQSAVRGLLRRLTAGDGAAADDLAQEVFVKAWRQLRTWRGDARLATWLYRIAWTTWASASRRAPSPQPPPPEPPRPFDASAIDRADLARALATLREEERTALALTYAQDVTHEEAAEILGWPVGTLKTHVLRGKERLRRLLVPATEGTP
jgi:RNA polymerase sigma-70 factor (ECF subfamily)